MTKGKQEMGVGGIIILLLIGLILVAPAFANGGDQNHHCQGGHNCNSYGEDGQDGQDGERGPRGYRGHQGEQGETGEQGIQGERGLTGERGLQGIAGINGRDGVVDQSWITETRNWQSKWNNYAAAMNAVQIHLPQDRNSRLTAGVSSMNGTSGYGLGYAYKFGRDDNLAVTVGVGTSGGEQVGVASVGFEFGGRRSAVNAHMTEDLQRQLRVDTKNADQDLLIQELMEEIKVLRQECSESVDKAFANCVQK